jgi:aldose sugar dehydrogenase
MNTLSCIMLLLLTALMIFYPTQGSGTEEQTHSNGISMNLESEGEATRTLDQNLAVKAPKFDARESVGNSNMNSKTKFTRVDNESTMVNFNFPSFGNESLISCNRIFKCTSSFSGGWKDDTSFRISTNNTNNTWSSIYGQEIDVKSNKSYELVTHMKLNKWAKQSHVALEGFNETSKHWNQIKQCPSGTNGPLEWHEFTCIITILENITKIRPVLNAGWTSQPKKEAVTWYDSVYLINLGKFFVIDPNLKIELVARGLKAPTSMSFLGADDILVLQKDNGTVRRVVDGKVLKKPLLDVPVATKDERGMLGIAISRSEFNNRTYVFLYFTESATGRDGDDKTTKKEPLGNRLYRYEYIDGKLINPKLLLDLPASPPAYHNGGVLTIGPDKQSIYLVIGDLEHKTKTVNNKTGMEPDGASGILRLTLYGEPVHGSILGDKYPLNLYYAYGIRNSFGIDFDPVTGNLWDTENGPDFGDEINLVEPGFNSGWKKVQGIWTVANGGKKGNLISEDPQNLVDFNGRGKYSSPEFTWNYTVAPTAIKFLTTDKLGEQYKNDMFVADENTHRIYHFKLNQNRTALLLEVSLMDKIADNNNELDNVIFAGVPAGGYGGIISDLDVGPDGYLYILSHDFEKIYRIVPRNLNDDGRPLD